MELISSANDIRLRSTQENRVLDIKIKATLSDPNPGQKHVDKWLIESNSTDVVNFISEDRKETLVKEYPVQGRNDGLKLVCEFSINPKSVYLTDIILELPVIQN